MRLKRGQGLLNVFWTQWIYKKISFERPVGLQKTQKPRRKHAWMKKLDMGTLRPLTSLEHTQ